MFTETELREAIRHSAARADDLIEAEQQQLTAPVDLPVPIDLVPPPERRRTWVPAVAAAVVLAVAGGALFLAAKPAHRSAPSPQKDVPAATAKPSPSRPVAVAPRVTVALTNLVTIPGDSGYTLDARMETVTPPAGRLQLMALPSSRFDPAKQLTGAHPVTVAGTQGYAGKALLWLIDPNDTEQANKAGAPRNTIAWRAGSGTWLVLQNFMADENPSEAALLHDAGTFVVQTAPALLRSGYRAGWLPAGLTLSNVAGSVGHPAVGLTLSAGAKSINISFSTVEFTNVTVGAGANLASKHIAGYWVSVFGAGYDQATVQRVLDHLDFSKLHAPQSTWWTLDQAVNS
jgi:hypothetical protein